MVSKDIFFNSVYVAVVGVILTVIVCSLAGYAFAKLNFKGNDKLFLFLILTMIVPSEVIIVPLFLIVKNLGWLNTFKALILPLRRRLACLSCGRRFWIYRKI